MVLDVGLLDFIDVDVQQLSDAMYLRVKKQLLIRRCIQRYCKKDCLPLDLFSDGFVSEEGLQKERKLICLVENVEEQKELSKKLLQIARSRKHITEWAGLVEESSEARPEATMDGQPQPEGSFEETFEELLKCEQSHFSSEGRAIMESCSSTIEALILDALLRQTVNPSFPNRVSWRHFVYTGNFQSGKDLERCHAFSRSISAGFSLLQNKLHRSLPHIFQSPNSSGLRAPPRNPPSQSFNEALSRNSAINGGLCRRVVVARGFLLQQGRFFHVDTRGYQHFQRKGFGGPHGSDRTRLYSLILISIGGIFVLVYTTHQEVVPYTLRKHCVLISPQLEASLVDRQFDAMKKQWKSKILPPIHPQAVRVRKIAKDVIRAVMEGTKLDDDAQLLEEGHKEKVEWVDHIDTPVSEQWGGHNEVLDEQWADQSRKKGLKEGAKPFVEHLKPAKWEVIVVDEDVTNAFALPGGKIVIYTGLLKRFPGDADIATVLSHEVAHVVARHGAEKLTRHFFVLLVELFVLTFFYAPDLVRTASTLFLELPFSRSQELEADHIGLLVMAAAGYDPRVAPNFYEKLGELGGSSDLTQYVATHPSGSKRGERLRRTGTMEQAVNIYMEKTQGKTVEGFL